MVLATVYKDNGEAAAWDRYCKMVLVIKKSYLNTLRNIVTKYT